MTEDNNPEFDPFDNTVAFDNDVNETEKDAIDASMVNINKSASINDSDDDDFMSLMESDKAQINDVTEESVTSHVEQHQLTQADVTATTSHNDETKESPTSSKAPTIKLPSTPQEFANHLAVTFEAQIKGDKTSVTATSPKRWQYNYRIQFQSTVIHLCQVEFHDTETIIRMRFSQAMLVNKQSDAGAMRLAVLQLLIRSLNLGHLAFLTGDKNSDGNELILLPSTNNPFARLFAPQLEFNVGHNGSVGIKVTDHE